MITTTRLSSSASSSSILFVLYTFYEGNFKLQTNPRPLSIYSMFDFFTESDPTHGRVTFVGREEAKASKLAFVQNDGTIVLGVNDKTVLQRSQNRKS